MTEIDEALEALERAEKLVYLHPEREKLFKKVRQALERQRVPDALSRGREIVERIAQIQAHRACAAEEHDPENGKVDGFCVVCSVPFPCKYAGQPAAAGEER